MMKFVVVFKSIIKNKVNLIFFTFVFLLFLGLPKLNESIDNSAVNYDMLCVYCATTSDMPLGSWTNLEDSPDRNGEKVHALKWRVDKQPSLNLPSIQGWGSVSDIQFWIYNSQSYPNLKLKVLLLGSSGKYFISSTEVLLDFTGWKNFVIPLNKFSTSNGANLNQMTNIGFRSQGYGQPILPNNLILLLDDFKVSALEGSNVQVPTVSMSENFLQWESYSKNANPYETINSTEFIVSVPQFHPPENVTSTWAYRDVAQNIIPIAYAAKYNQVSNSNSLQLVNHTIEAIDWLLSKCNEDGYWWRNGDALRGDPNVNRFVLGQLLDAVLMIKDTPQAISAWSRWESKLKKAIEFQRKSYNNQVSWDWGGVAGGHYVNQDVYYALIMELSSQIWPSNIQDHQAGAEMINKIKSQLLPDGGFHYAGRDNESPPYHWLNIVILARYLTLTNSETALEIIKGTVDYWPYTMTRGAQAEYWSDIWTKQYWDFDITPESLVIVSGLTNDSRNKHLMWQSLLRHPIGHSNWAQIYALPYWPVDPSDNFNYLNNELFEDRNIKGLRGRNKNWYYGVAQGRGLRTTFTGGLISDSASYFPHRSIFRGAHIDVLEKNTDSHGYWLSTTDDYAGMAKKNDAVAIGTRFTLQKSVINWFPEIKTNQSPYMTTQIWKAGDNGIIGFIALEAMSDTKAAAVVGRINFGPCAISMSSNLWNCSGLSAKIYRSFGSVDVSATPSYGQSTSAALPSIELRSVNQNNLITKGSRYVYSLWVGPKSNTPPASIMILTNDVGWVATWEDRKQTATLFNPAKSPIIVNVPWLSNDAKVFRGLEKENITSLINIDKNIQISLAAGETIIIEN